MDAHPENCRVPHLLSARARNEFPRWPHAWAPYRRVFPTLSLALGVGATVVFLIGRVEPEAAAVTDAVALGAFLLAACVAVIDTTPEVVTFLARRAVARVPRLRGWADIPLHWTDWWRVPAARVSAQDAEPYYVRDRRDRTRGAMTRRTVTRLAVVEALAGHNVYPSFRYNLGLDGWYPLLRLLHAGAPVEDLNRLVTAHAISEADLIALLDRVPQMTVPDLMRFLRTDITADLRVTVSRATIASTAAHLNDLYALAGRGASWYALLGLSDSEIRDAVAQDTSEESLRTLVALS